MRNPFLSVVERATPPSDPESAALVEVSTLASGLALPLDGDMDPALVPFDDDVLVPVFLSPDLSIAVKAVVMAPEVVVAARSFRRSDLPDCSPLDLRFEPPPFLDDTLEATVLLVCLGVGVLAVSPKT
jgi:hypothetical protein